MSAIRQSQTNTPAPGGVVLVTTENGTRYRIDFTSLRVARFPDVDTWPGGRLRRDEEELQLLGVRPITVGQPMRMMLDLREDGVPTARQTGFVTSVEWLA